MAGKLKIKTKLSLIALGFLVPILILIFLLISEQNISIDFARKEIDGAAKIRDLQATADNLRAVAAGTEEGYENALENLNRFDNKRFAFSVKVSDLRSSILNSRRQPQKMEILLAALSQVEQAVVKIGDESNLVLDPDLESYYLMYISVTLIPDLEKQLFRRLLLDENDVNLHASFAMLLTSIEESYAIYNDNSKDKELAQKLISRFHVIKNNLDNHELTSFSNREKIWENLLSLNELRKSTLNVLEDSISARIAGFNSKKIYTLGGVLGILFLTGFIFLYVAGSITANVKKLDEAAKKVINGEKMVSVSVDSGDEFARLSADFNTMIERIEKNIKEKSDRLIKAQTALDTEISRHNKTEEALSKSELLFSQVWGISADGMRLTDENGIVLAVNEAFCRIVNKKREEIEGKHFAEVYHESIRESVGKMYEDDFRNDAIKPHFERESLLWDDRKIWIGFANSFLTLKGSGTLLLSIIKDISERKKAELELKEYAQQLRNLASHLQSIREEERKLIAREIHDELGQVLTVLKIQITLLSNKLHTSQADLKEKILSVSGVIDKTVDSVQKISSQLRPGLLDDLGLIAALEWQTQDFQKRTGIICDYSFPKRELELTQEKNTAIFRIFQETLTNAARHAKASRILINMRVSGNYLTLKVTDNGRGISKNEVENSKSFGLLGMKERALLFDGDVKISGASGRGTTVKVTLPINNTVLRS